MKSEKEIKERLILSALSSESRRLRSAQLVREVEGRYQKTDERLEKFHEYASVFAHASNLCRAIHYKTGSPMIGSLCFVRGERFTSAYVAFYLAACKIEHIRPFRYSVQDEEYEQALEELEEQ